MELEVIVLREISKETNNNVLLFPFIYGIQLTKANELEKSIKINSGLNEKMMVAASEKGWYMNGRHDF